MVNAFFKELYRTFVSRKVTIYLIAFLSLFYFLGLIIPQRSLLDPGQFAAWQAQWPLLVETLTAVKLTSIYSSPLVIGATVLFFLNLLLVTAKRVPAVFRSMQLPGSTDLSMKNVETLPVHEKFMLDDAAGVAAVRSRIQRSGFRVIEGRGCFRAVRNRFAPAGSLLFHGSFLLILLGGMFLFHTRFRGETFITEGQLFNGSRSEYRSVTRYSEMRKSLPDLRITVEKIAPRFEKREPVSLATRITAQSNGVRRTGAFDVNAPFVMGTTSVLITDVGIAPYVRVVDRRGRELLGAFVSLNVIRGDEDHFTIPDTDYTVWVKFWPDAAVDEAGNRTTRSYDLKHPVYEIAVRKGGSDVASGTITDAARSVLFEGLQLSIPEMRYFGRFMIVDERGGGLLIAGFILALAGLTIKFLFPKQEVLGAWHEADGKTAFLVGYQGEYLRGLGKQEFDRILSGDEDL